MARHCITTEADFMDMKNRLMRADVVSFDVETRTLHAEIVGYSFAFQYGSAFYVPVRHRDGDQLAPEWVAPHIQEILRERPNVGHHTKYDLACCLREGISYVPTFDSMMETHLTGNAIPSLMRSTGEDEDEGGGGGLGLKDLVLENFNYKMKNLVPDLFPTKKSVSFDLLPLQVATDYSGDDADYTLRLHNVMYPKVECPYLYKVEMAIVLIEVAMEFQGIYMNRAYMTAESERLFLEAEALRKNLCDFIGSKVGYIVEFDPGNTHQCADILFDKLKVPVQKRSPKTKKPSTADDSLGKIREQFPVVNSVLCHREIIKAAKDFYGKLGTLLGEDDRVHTTYGLTTSGRFSSTKPNVQNSAKNKTWHITPLFPDDRLQTYRAEVLSHFGVPDYTLATDLRVMLPEFGIKELGEYDGHVWIINRHGDLSYRVETVPRKAYRPSPGLVLWEADYDQVESKILAAEAGELSLLAQFMRFEDVHKIVASQALGVPIDKITKSQREVGKSINHAIPYGMSEYGLAARAGLEVEEAARMLDTYFKARPAVRLYIDRVRERAEITHRVVTRFGRKQVVPEFNAANEVKVDAKDPDYKAKLKLKRSLLGKAKRASVNRIIQGTSADITKIAMVRVDMIIKRDFTSKGKLVRMIMTNHDSLALEVDPTQVTDAEMIALLLEGMCFPIKGYPPITVTIKKGDNWGSMKEVWTKDDWLKSDLLQKLQLASGIEIPTAESVMVVAAKVAVQPVSPPPPSPNVKSVTIIIKTKDGVNPAQAAQLKKLLMDNPGVNIIELDGQRLEKYQTCLGLEARPRFEAIVPCQVSLSKQDIDIGALLR